MYKSIKTGQFLKFLDRVAEKPSAKYQKKVNYALWGIYVEPIAPDSVGDARVLLCATDGHVICVRKMFHSDVKKVALEDGFHFVKGEKYSLLYSYKKFTLLPEDERNKAVEYPQWRRVLTDLKPLPPILADNNERRFPLFDGDHLALCRDLLDGRAWLPNFASWSPPGMWAYIDDEILVGCMPVRSRADAHEETREYTVVFPELQHIEPKAKAKAKAKKAESIFPEI